MSGRRYLVTGGLGFLGASLVRHLVEAGHQVRVLDNGSRGSEARVASLRTQVEIIKGDIRDAKVVQRSLQGMDSVCHLAAINGTEYFYERPADVLEVAVKGMLNVLDGCVAEGVGELLFASSSEVYQSPPAVPTDENVQLSIPDPLNPRYSYAGGKIVSELMAINYGRKHFDRVLIFRPHNVYGPDMGCEHVIPQFTVRLLRLLSTEGKAHKIPVPINGTGEQSRSFIYIEDCVAALMLILEKGDHLNIYNIGTTEEVTIRDLAHRVANLLGAQIEIVPGPAPKGEPLRRCPDISKLQSMGYRPRFRLDDGLRPTVEWYIAHQPVGSAT